MIYVIENNILNICLVLFMMKVLEMSYLLLVFRYRDQRFISFVSFIVDVRGCCLVANSQGALV